MGGLDRLSAGFYLARTSKEDLMSEPIKIWRFRDAPEEYRELSEHGGDEDFVMLVPSALVDEFLIDRVVDLGLLGCSSTDKYERLEGHVFIGAHS